MLGNKEAAANIAVKNLETAKKFYEDILGLTQVGIEGQEAIVYKSGTRQLLSIGHNTLALTKLRR